MRFFGCFESLSERWVGDLVILERQRSSQGESPYVRIRAKSLVTAAPVPSTVVANTYKQNSCAHKQPAGARTAATGDESRLDVLVRHVCPCITPLRR